MDLQEDENELEDLDGADYIRNLYKVCLFKLLYQLSPYLYIIQVRYLTKQLQNNSGAPQHNFAIIPKLF
jgi:hypothetical protein